MVTDQYLSTSSVPKGYQVVKWFFEGMIKTDTFRDLINPITNPVYNASIRYTAPNYTFLERNDTKPTELPEWIFNGTHLIGSYNRNVQKISDPNTGVLVSNWFYNASHQIDFTNNKIYAFGPHHYSPLKSAQQRVTWFVPSNGLIKIDTFRDLQEPLTDVSFNLSEIYFGGNNYTSIYKNESHPRRREWAYNGTHLVNVNYPKIAHSVPSPVKAVIVNNVFNNITHQTDYLMKKTYPVRNEMGAKFYQTISWYFNGLVRVDTLRNLQEPIIDPVFDIENIYLEDPNSTYIYKNESKPPIYVPPKPVPEWLYNGTHVNNVLRRIFYPIADPNVADITSNWFYNATHKTDLLNRKTYSTGVKPSSMNPITGYQVVTCRFKGIMRQDTYKELFMPLEEPNCNLTVIYSNSPNYTTFYADEKVSILPVRQPEWSFNGTHNINIYTNVAYPVDTMKQPSPKEEWIFNGTHKVNLLTKEAYPKEPEKQTQPEWTFNGTHRINTYTKKAYPVDSTLSPQPKDEWIFNGTHKLNLLTKEAYPVEPERPLQEEWIFNGTHKTNTYTKKSYPIDSVAPPQPKDQWIFNGTHKVNLLTKEAYTSEYENSQPPKKDWVNKDEWVFNGTHKVNYATNVAYAVKPVPDTHEPEKDVPKKDHQIEPEIPMHRDEWIFNGTHKVNVRTKEAHFVPGNEKERDFVRPTMQPEAKEYPDVFTFNGTHKVNYHTNEAYAVADIGIAPPQFIEDKREKETNKLDSDYKKPEISKIIPVDSSNKDQIAMPVKPPPMIYTPNKDQQQKNEQVAPQLPESIKSAATKIPTLAPKIDSNKTTKKPQSQHDVKVKAEPKFKCAGEDFKVSIKTNLIHVKNAKNIF